MTAEEVKVTLAQLEAYFAIKVRDGKDGNVAIELFEKVKELEKVLEQDLKTEQFAKWVATEIFDENWEYNKDAFAELACRWLAELGIVRANGDEWELVEPQESEDEE